MMAVKFGTNRGQKVHVVNPETLDNRTVESLCGRRIDNVETSAFATSTLLCGNCKRTRKYTELVG